MYSFYFVMDIGYVIYLFHNIILLYYIKESMNLVPD